MAAPPSASARSKTIVGNTDFNFWLFDPSTGFDLTHPSSPDGPPVEPRVTLQTTTEPITIAPEKTALIIVDMQNFFLSSALGAKPGQGHKAEAKLLSQAIPTARKAGIQIVHVTWGISDKDVAVLPPVICRGFGYEEIEPRKNTESSSAENPQPSFAKEVKSDTGIGDDLGNVKLPDGTEVSAGRMLMRDQWNTALHDPLQQDYDASQKTALPDVRFHKARLSGFWGGSTPCIEYLHDKKISTLLFAGVNTDQCVLACLQDACNMGFDTILLKDGCGTDSPDYARMMSSTTVVSLGDLSLHVKRWLKESTPCRFELPTRTVRMGAGAGHIDTLQVAVLEHNIPATIDPEHGYHSH